MSHIYIIDPMGFPGQKSWKNMAHLSRDKAFQRKLISPTKTVRFSCFCVSEMVLALSMLHCFVSRCFCRYYIPGWLFPTCFIFNPIWGRFPFWLIFFRCVETTNQIPISFVFHRDFGGQNRWKNSMSDFFTPSIFRFDGGCSTNKNTGGFRCFLRSGCFDPPNFPLREP